MEGFRKIEALKGVPTGNDPGAAPEIVFLEPSQLVVNEEYQRELSKASLRQIKRMAAAWDWSSFKAPSVARTEDPDIYEVVDGQHTAIGAATNGNIHFLPCLVMSAETLAEKAKGFLGINQDRIALTKVAIYNAQVAAQDETAIAVECALSATDCRLLDVPPPNGRYAVGDTMAIATLLQLARIRGEARLTELLRIAKAAKAAPVSAGMLKALDLLLPMACTPEVANRVIAVLGGQGAGRLEMIAKSRTPHGAVAYITLADMISEMAKLPSKRMGKPPKRQPARALVAA